MAFIWRFSSCLAEPPKQQWRGATASDIAEGGESPLSINQDEGSIAVIDVLQEEHVSLDCFLTADLSAWRASHLAPRKFTLALARTGDDKGNSSTHLKGSMLENRIFSSTQPKDCAFFADFTLYWMQHSTILYSGQGNLFHTPCSWADQECAQWRLRNLNLIE